MNKLILSIFLISSTFISAQQVVSSSGDFFTNTNGSVTFTVGEVVIETLLSGANNVTQGFHQTNLSVLAVDDLENNTVVKIFPNPTQERLQININDFTNKSLKLFDITGRLLKQKTLDKNSDEISLDGLNNGMYLLVLYSDTTKKIKTFRIIKN